MEKYYLAYEDRYKQIHSEGSLWFSNEPTQEVFRWINNYLVKKDERVCEIGCGEGRDSLYLAKQGYDILGVDVSKTAIEKCREIAATSNLNCEFKVIDGLELSNSLNEKYKYIYSIGTLHMMVRDEDRARFLSEIYKQLTDGGKLLLVNMGNGKTENMTEIGTETEYKERLENGQLTKVKVIPYRSVNCNNHKKELEEIGFKIDDMKIIDTPHYGKCIATYASK